MQPVTGLNLLREIRADATLLHLPFIMITAESKSQNVAVVKAAGVDNYIFKPFNTATLMAKITSALGTA